MLTRSSNNPNEPSLNRQFAASSAARSAVGLPPMRSTPNSAHALSNASSPPEQVSESSSSLARELMLEIVGDPAAQDDSPSDDVQMNDAQEPVVKSFVDHLDATPKFKRLAELVPNPCRLVGSGFKVVPRAFALCKGVCTWDTIQLMNVVFISWQEEYRMSRPDKKTGCPYYKASSQSKHLRSFFAFMGKNHGWTFTFDTFSNFKGCLTDFLKELYTKRGEQWVSKNCVSMFVCFTLIY